MSKKISHWMAEDRAEIEQCFYIVHQRPRTSGIDPNRSKC